MRRALDEHAERLLTEYQPPEQPVIAMSPLAWERIQKAAARLDVPPALDGVKVVLYQNPPPRRPWWRRLFTRRPR